MKPIDYLKTAVIGLKANKVRSALTVLGIIIGIAAVIAMMSIGQGAQSLIIDQIMSLGSNNIFIEPGPWSERMESGQMMQTMMEEFEIKTLKYEDALAIQEIPNIKMAAPFVMGVTRVIFEGQSKKISFWGTTPEAAEVTDTKAAFGRHILDQDVKSMAKVAVLGYKLKQDLFGENDPIGKIIRIQKINFRVIGITEEKGAQMIMNVDDGLYLPITTAQKLLLGQDYIRMIIAEAQTEKSIDEAIYEIRLLLRERHNIYNPENDLSKDDFKVMSQKDTAAMLSSVTNIFTILLSSIAAISLVVGGIGIMNIMLVSVTERTREIGLRKAVGASEKDILTQFLWEAIILTLTGGILGIILGALLSWGASMAFNHFLNASWGFSLPLYSIILGVGVSASIGLVFGIYPARKASQLSPIDALRYE